MQMHEERKKRAQIRAVTATVAAAERKLTTRIVAAATTAAIPSRKTMTKKSTTTWIKKIVKSPPSSIYTYLQLCGRNREGLLEHLVKILLLLACNLSDVCYYSILNFHIFICIYNSTWRARVCMYICVCASIYSFAGTFSYRIIRKKKERWKKINKWMKERYFCYLAVCVHVFVCVCVCVWAHLRFERFIFLTRCWSMQCMLVLALWIWLRILQFVHIHFYVAPFYSSFIKLHLLLLLRLFFFAPSLRFLIFRIKRKYSVKSGIVRM